MFAIGRNAFQLYRLSNAKQSTVRCMSSKGRQGSDARDKKIYALGGLLFASTIVHFWQANKIAQQQKLIDQPLGPSTEQPVSVKKPKRDVLGDLFPSW